MSAAAILALASAARAIVALTSAAAPHSSPLPPAQLEIAMRVAATGLPQCTSYLPDGSQGPCLPSFALKRGGSINAWSANGQITITSTAAARLTRDEFALLAAHEVAHWYLGHTKSTREAELAADELGAKLACAAGFDPAAGAGLFRHLKSDGAHASAKVRVEVVVRVGCGAQTRQSYSWAKLRNKLTLLNLEGRPSGV